MLNVILVIVVIGVLLYLVERFIPMDATIRTILRVVVIIALILWLLSVFGVLSRLDTPVPHVSLPPVVDVG